MIAIAFSGNRKAPLSILVGAPVVLAGPMGMVVIATMANRAAGLS